MKSLFSVVFLFIFFSSCTHNYKPRKIDNVIIKPFKTDSTSIRSLVAIDSLTMYFAGSNGYLGYTNNGGKTWQKTQ
ncbi:MAG: oxidoreductase, partial [Flavobacteriaceae bacterium]